MKLVVITPDELAALVREAVRDAVAEALADQPDTPPLLDQQGLARALDISIRTLRKLVLQGMPELRVGDSPRYEIDAVLAWLRDR